MVIPIVESSSEVYKIRKIFGKKSTYPKKMIEFKKKTTLKVLALIEFKSPHDTNSQNSIIFFDYVNF